MGQTLAAFDALLKDVYRGPMIAQINKDTYLLDQIEREDVNRLGAFDAAGRRLIFPVQMGRNRARAAGAMDGGTLARAGRADTQSGIVTIRNYNTAIELTQAVVKQSESNEGAFVSAMRLEMEDAPGALRRDLCRVGYGTGDGLLASCTSTQTARTIAVDSGQYIAVGDLVDVLTRADGTVRGTACTVTAVTYTGTRDGSSQANANITLDTSVSVTNAEGIYVSGSRNNEGDGLRNISATGRRLHSIDSSTYPQWDGNASAAGWVNVSEDMLMEQAQKAAQRAGGSETLDVYLTTFGIQRRLANQYTSQKRYNDAQSTRIDGGYSAIFISAGGKPVPVVGDVDCPNGYALGLRKRTFAWTQLGKPDWMMAPDGRGGVFHLKAGSTAGTHVAAWIAYFEWWATLVNVRPQANVQVSQLFDDIPVARV